MDIKWLLDTPVAHRGLHGDGAPENSLSAFQRAIDNGFNIETDVRLTRDGVLVCFHDDDAMRMTGNPSAISDLSLDELRALTLGDSTECVPTLSELLSITAGKVGLLIEIKNSGKVGELERALERELRSYRGNYAVQSFNPFSIKWFKDNAPEVARGILSTNFEGTLLKWYKKYLLKKLAFNFLIKPHFIAYYEKLLPCKTVSKKNLPVLGWTVRSEERAVELANCSALNNVIFENFIPSENLLKIIENK